MTTISLEKSKTLDFDKPGHLELSPIVDRTKRSLEVNGIVNYTQPTVPGVEMSLDDHTLDKNGEEEISGLSGIQETQETGEVVKEVSNE